MSDFAPSTQEEFIRGTTKELARLKRHAAGAGVGEMYLGTMPSFYTSGKPLVLLDGGASVLASVNPRDPLIKSDARVILKRVGSEWYILSTIADTPQFNRMLPLPLSSLASVYEDGAWAPPRFTKSIDSVVTVAGLMNPGTTLTSGTVIATLPVGFRPEVRKMFICNNSGTVRRLDIQTNGDITLGPNFTNSWISLSNIVFRLAPSWTTLTPVSPWVQFGSDWGNLGYAVDSYNTLWLRGLVKSGSTTDGTVLANLAAGTYPSHQSHFMTTSGDTYGAISTDAGGALRVKGGSNNGYLSVDGQAHTITGSSGDSAYTPLMLTSNWVRNSTLQPLPSAWLRPDKIVMLRGLLAKSTGASDTVATLPVGMRPATKLMFVYARSLNGARCDISPDGVITMTGGIGNWHSLDSITFSAEQ